MGRPNKAQGPARLAQLNKQGPEWLDGPARQIFL
jgi:hypothetical protein